MSGESDAIATLVRQSLNQFDAYLSCRDAIAASFSGIMKSTDLVACFRAVNSLSLACEAMARVAEDLHKEADQALVFAMEETGAPAFRTEHHTVTTRRRPSAVHIHDLDAVPPDMMTQPAPYPDKTKIRKWLETHPETNWATMRESGVGLQRRRIDP